MNDDGNFRNGPDSGNVRNVGNVKNFRNVRTDIKCHIFLKPRPQVDLNDDSNFRNGGNFRNVRNDRNVENVRIYIKCHNFSETEALTYLENSGMVECQTVADIVLLYLLKFTLKKTFIHF